MGRETSTAAQLRDVKALNRETQDGPSPTRCLERRVVSSLIPGLLAGVPKECSCASHQSRRRFEGRESLGLTCGNP